MQQRPDIETYFDRLFDHYLPAIIIELGTGDGEFTNILFSLMKNRTDQFNIHSFDLYRDKAPNAPGCYHKMDIFKNEDFIANIIHKPVSILLLCDNGDKIREVTMFAKYLKRGDVIMAHDYAYDRESFNRLKYWRTCEITFADIKDSVQGFRPYHQELMIQAGWLSLIKM
jgi:hypothetical protein